MSQSKVNSFFLQRKGTRDGHAAKRRKLDGLISNSETTGIPVHGKETRSVMRSEREIKTLSFESSSNSKLDDNDSESHISRSIDQNPNLDLNSKSKLEIQFSKKKSLTGRKSRSGSKSCRGKISKSCKNEDKRQQKKLTDFNNFSPVSSNEHSLDCNKTAIKASGIVSKEHVVPPTVFPDDDVCDESKFMDCQEEITSVLDDHVALSQEGMSTPRKKIITVEDTLSQGPLSRRRKTAVRKMKNASDEVQTSSLSESDNVDIRKKLYLDVAKEVVSQSQLPVNNCIAEQTPTKPCDKFDLLAAVSEISETHTAISPLALTPEHQSPSPSANSGSPKLHNLSEKLQALSKMNGKALKNRLKQKGLLKDCKEKLADMTNAGAASDAIQSQSSPCAASSSSESVDKEKDLPAYQRFDYLGKEGPPTLTLPYSYRLLENAFQAMDTVVSMLHNRSEVCTFSKLKSAVQVQTRKNFEEKIAGQIKTVLPDAYLFRQEKNIPMFGQKKSGYQLTVEANLKDQGSNTNVTKDGKASFSIKLIQKRKESFRHRLVHFVKQHHKEFLASLNPPLSIPDAKLSRWHPKFHLDEVPAIPAAHLPQSPDAKVCRSAQNVLEIIQKGNANPRVEHALQKVVAEKNALLKSNSMEGSDSSSQEGSSSSASTSNLKQTTASLKGIPPALLAKIRAKESRKMEEALTRNPAEDKKTKMMNRLPEVIRILRSYFVTEKKPALPMATVFKKLEDSYKSGMALGDVEQHINLLKELAPEFVSVVEIKSGKYLKLDKNVDISAITSRITNLVKSRQ